MKAAGFLLAIVLSALPARAQSAEARWTPFLGCWELTVDAVRDTAPALRPLAGNNAAPRIRRESTPRVCVTATPQGARFETTIAGQQALDHTIVADGTERPLTDGECRGSQRAQWSRNGLRLFSSAHLTCAGDAGPRRISGLSLLAGDGTWLDIQSVEIGGRESVRVRRYYRSPDAADVPAPAVGSRLTLDEIKEASAKLSVRVVEAALVESGAGFDLRGAQLVDLDESGVADSVIDLLVALSYPERFVIERTSRGGGGGGGGTMFFNDPFLLGWAFGYPTYFDDFYYSPYYYSPFGYYRSRGYGGGFYGDVLAVGGGAPPGPQPSGQARAIDGQGYTRIRAREATPTVSGGGRSSPVSTSSASSGASTASSSGGSTASSGGGYSSGGSSSSDGGGGGRTAVPR